MSEPSDALLRDAQKQAGEIYLAGHNEKHEMEQLAVQTALDADRARLADHRVAHDHAHSAHEQLHRVTETSHREQHISEQRAVEAAVASMDKRLEGMNEFRESLRDQSQTFARKDALDALDAQVERRYEELRSLVQTEKEERRGQEGVKRGMSQTTAVIVGAIGLAATLITIVVLIANFAT